MKRVSALLIAGVFAIGLVGCSEKSSVKTEKTVTTPDASQKVTTETTVEKTGDAKTNP